MNYKTQLVPAGDLKYPITIKLSMHVFKIIMNSHVNEEVDRPALHTNLTKEYLQE